MMLQRNLLYTGVTRAKKLVLAGSRRALSPKPSPPQAPAAATPHSPIGSTPRTSVVYMRPRSPVLAARLHHRVNLNDVYVVHHIILLDNDQQRAADAGALLPAGAVAGAPNGRRLLRPKARVSVGLTQHPRGCCFLDDTGLAAALPLSLSARPERKSTSRSPPERQRLEPASGAVWDRTASGAPIARTVSRLILLRSRGASQGRQG
jgi:hypothetical protein